MRGVKHPGGAFLPEVLWDVREGISKTLLEFQTVCEPSGRGLLSALFRHNVYREYQPSFAVAHPNRRYKASLRCPSATVDHQRLQYQQQPTRASTSRPEVLARRKQGISISCKLKTDVPNRRSITQTVPILTSMLCYTFPIRPTLPRLFGSST
ncbi:hypothetical protein BU25DRAFT_266207 [Macroventuria anomochaeta]|uniref:Uncharacterized protein n=1 Tax=Macroventuria anomochaeta TaxID=301207 RepID=A0ACB6S7V1_9PLEO|nr:uncharacterized protein BU25DRAFT_266207 [Macroventuria anomochaeta]KAF2630139.1 hypothetical protein BU25DRAFT_266207 [Macroventuria anomochaeta]